MLLLIIKLTLAPALVAGATLAGRRWGSRISGWLVGFPIVAGPLLLLFSMEQGNVFASQAAEGALVGLVALSFFLLVYAWAALKVKWPAALALGWISFALVTLLMRGSDIPWPAGLLAAFAAFKAVLWGLPVLAKPQNKKASPWDLPLRMAATAALVLSLTTAAKLLGPALSGLLTPFPVASTVLAVFAHHQAGAAGVTAVYRGFLPGLFGFAVFCAVLAVALPALGRAQSFFIALTAVILIQIFVLKILKHSN